MTLVCSATRSPSPKRRGPTLPRLFKATVSKCPKQCTRKHTATSLQITRYHYNRLRRQLYVMCKMNRNKFRSNHTTTCAACAPLRRRSRVTRHESTAAACPLQLHGNGEVLINLHFNVPVILKLNGRHPFRIDRHLSVHVHNEDSSCFNACGEMKTARNCEHENEAMLSHLHACMILCPWDGCRSPHRKASLIHHSPDHNCCIWHQKEHESRSVLQS